MTSQVKISMLKASGKAKSSHCAKLISGAVGNEIEKIRCIARFGGVPISVPVPPIEQEYAIPSIIAYRHFRAQIDSLTIEMEQRAIKLVEIVHGTRAK